MSIEEYRDANGDVRKLGWVAPSTDAHRMARASTISIGVLRQAAGLPPLIDPADYQPRDFVTPFPSLVNNQQDCSGCTAWSGGQAFRRQRLIRGMPDHDFSGAFLYAQINGGRDNGSAIIDAMTALQNTGVCLRSEFDYPHLFKNQIPASAYVTAGKFKLLRRVTVNSSAECATALQMGMIPCRPICADASYERWSGDGVARVSPRSTGNHAIHLAGMIQVAGQWKFLQPGSWGTSWGPFVKSKPEWAGCVLLDFASIDNCDSGDDGYAHADSMWEKMGETP